MLKRDKSEYTIGVDIGGTKMSAALFDGKRVLADYTLATPKEDLNKFMVMLLALIEPLRDRATKDKVKIKGIGLGIPGPVDEIEGIILTCRNIPILNNVKIVDLVKEKIDREMIVKIDNDAKCFTRAEALIGAGKNYKNVFGITLGTGVGSGWWVNNEIYSAGGHGSAIEVASMIIDFGDSINLESAYRRLTQSNPGILADEAYRGDALAVKSYEEFGRLLGVAFANIANLVDPDIFVVGGNVIKSADLFLPKTKKAMQEFIFNPEAKDIKVVKSKLGDLAGAIGAALLI